MSENFQLEEACPVKDGIEKCEDKCQCGGTLRLHAYTFNRHSPFHKQRYYVDCDRSCGKVGPWMDSIDEAVAAFDACAGIKVDVQEA